MKILVIGSICSVTDEKKREQFKTACHQLGYALAKAGCELIVGSDDPETADKYVVEGMIAESSKRKIWVFRPTSSRRRPFDKEQERYKGQIEFVHQIRYNSWDELRVPQILAADAVILIGGGPATAQVGYVAPALERPVLAIPYFGGSAYDLWDSFEPFYERLDPNLKEKFDNFRVDWHSSNSDLAVQILQEALKRRFFQRETTSSPSWSICFASLFLIAIWVWLFVVSPEPHGIIFFALLGVSAFLGTGLRNTLRWLRDPTIRFSLNRLSIELTAGLLLAFGLAIIFLIGGFTIIGRFEFIPSTNQPEDFQRISLAMSVLGFAAGWLTENAAESLQNWLYIRLPSQDDKNGVV